MYIIFFNKKMLSLMQHNTPFLTILMLQLEKIHTLMYDFFNIQSNAPKLSHNR